MVVAAEVAGSARSGVRAVVEAEVSLAAGVALEWWWRQSGGGGRSGVRVLAGGGGHVDNYQICTNRCKKRTVLKVQ